MINFGVYQQVAQGTGLSFIAFTEAITKMPAPQVWSVLFFLMLITLGLGSMFGNIAGVVTPILDMGLLKIKREYLSGKCISSLFFHAEPDCCRVAHFSWKSQLRIC